MIQPFSRAHQDALLAHDGADGLQHARVLGRQLPGGAAADPPDRLQLHLRSDGGGRVSDS